MGSDWSKAVVLLHEAYNGKQTKPNSLQVGSKPEHMPVPLDEHSLEFQDTGPPTLLLWFPDLQACPAPAKPPTETTGKFHQGQPRPVGLLQGQKFWRDSVAG